jgi:hypothetical protein
MTRRAVLGIGAVTVTAGAAWAQESRDTEINSRVTPRRERRNRMQAEPKRFTIVPDDYHVPYAGTAEDGRKFFLSRELFDPEHSYVGLFLWREDGTFDRVDVTRVGRPRGVPAGMAGAAGPDDLVRDKLASLGDHTLEPITVEPFLVEENGTKFGWKFGNYENGTAYLNIEPGNFICYYDPWDGLEYDT